MTTLYGLDNRLNVLVTIGNINGTPNNPNTGLVFTVGDALPIPGSFGETNGFDISGATGTAYLAAVTVTGTNVERSLYTINLATGTATNRGLIGSGAFNVTGLSVFNAAPP